MFFFVKNNNTKERKKFYFQSFFNETFFSESFCMIFATANSKSSWVTWTRRSRRAYMPASVQTPYWKSKKNQKGWTSTFRIYFDFSTRCSGHHFSDLSQINTTSEIHFTRMNLENVQSSVFARRGKLDLSIDTSRT